MKSFSQSAMPASVPSMSQTMNRFPLVRTYWAVLPLARNCRSRCAVISGIHVLS